MWSVGIQREIPFGFTVDVSYVGRKGLYLQRERNINQLLPGTIQANPGVNIAALRPYTGLRRHPALRERGALELQQPADQRRPPLHERPEGRLRLHARQVGGQRQRQAQRALEHLRRHELLGPVELRPPPRAGRLLHLRPAVLQGAVGTRERTCSAAGRCRARRSSAPARRSRSLQTSHDIAGVGDVAVGQPWDLVGDPKANTNGKLSAGSGDQNFWFNPAAFARPAPGHVRQRARATCSTTRASSSGTSRCSRTSAWAARGACSCARSSSTSRTTRTWATPAERVGADRNREQRTGGGPDQRQQLRPRDHQERSARHPVERAVPVLGGAPRRGWGWAAGGWAGWTPDTPRASGSNSFPGALLSRPRPAEQPRRGLRRRLAP